MNGSSANEELKKIQQLLGQMQAKAIAKVEAINGEAEPRLAQLQVELAKLELAGDLVGCVALREQIKEFCQQTIDRIDQAYQQSEEALERTSEIL